jgi:tetratricopeptide (TPR) repeat protein
MKSSACSFAFAALFVGTPLQGGAQHTQQDVDHIYHCTDLMTQDNYLSDGINSINQMISYNKGSLSFGPDSEDLKSQMLRKVEALETENGTSELEALKRTLLTKSLGILRTEEAECFDTDQNKTWRTKRLEEIGSALDSLGQAEDAIPVYRRCIALDPDFAPCYESMGHALLDLNRKPEARDAFKKTIEIGGFNEWNAKYIQFARDYLAMLDREDEASREVPAREDAKPTQHSFATGFFVSNDGEILTNNHVVAGCQNLTIRNGQAVQVVTRDLASDLALGNLCISQQSASLLIRL